MMQILAMRNMDICTTQNPGKMRHSKASLSTSNFSHTLQSTNKNLMMQMLTMILIKTMIDLDHSQNPGKMRHSKAILRTSQDGNDQLEPKGVQSSLEAEAIGTADELMTLVSNVI